MQATEYARGGVKAQLSRISSFLLLKLLEIELSEICVAGEPPSPHLHRQERTEIQWGGQGFTHTASCS